MANADYENNVNYTNLSGAQKTLVDTAVTAIRAAYAGTSADGMKPNVEVLLKEVVKGQEET